MNGTQTSLLKLIRRLIFIFIIGLVLSGITAFPLEWQLHMAHSWIDALEWDNALTDWIDFVYEGVRETNMKYPFVFYGTDWLAFAHLVIAIVFIGPLRNPIRNVWVIEFGMIACVAVFPLALIAGSIREIPLFWRFVDCSFGVIGGLLLWRCHSKIKLLEKLTPNQTKPG